MTNNQYNIRNAKPEEFEAIGQLMVQVYSQLEGFPPPEKQPKYYETLAKVGDFTQKPGTELLLAISPEGAIGGAVVFFNDMQYYASGGVASKEKNAGGFRLLAVAPAHRGLGLGKLLIQFCIQKTQEQQLGQLIIHSTKAMPVAWKMYQKLGFQRSEELDFMQGQFPVCGFRLHL